MLFPRYSAAGVGSCTILLLWLWLVEGNPSSKPYIPFRTSPFDHAHLHHTLSWENPVVGTNKLTTYDADVGIPNPQCPLQFVLGVSRRHHHATKPGELGIIEPPVIFPALPALGPGRQVIYTTQYEHLDLLTPLRSTVQHAVIKEGLIQHVEYPLLFESSSFLTAPLLRDVNADGIVDVILADYDGGIYAMGLQPSPSTGKRYFNKAQVPRLYVRRQWMESRVNETLGIVPATKADDSKDNNNEEQPVAMTDDVPMDRYKSRDKPHDPYHSYFEYTYGTLGEHESVLRGVPASILGQDHTDAAALEERRKRKIQHAYETTDSEPGSHFVDQEDKGADSSDLNSGDQADHRRLQEVGMDETQKTNEDVAQPVVAEGQEHVDVHVDGDGQALEQGGGEGEKTPDQNGEAQDPKIQASADGGDQGGEVESGDTTGQYMDDGVPYDADDFYVGKPGDDMILGQQIQAEEEKKEAEVPPVYGDDDVPRSHDDAYPRYDDYYGRYGNTEHDEYYNEKHYVRLPPHILCTPVAAELPRMYTQNGEIDTLLFVAVSYYFDEDEYEGFFSYKRFVDRDQGDETEVQRGMYVANAIMVYQYGDSPRWGRQEHLDISADHTAPINTTLVGAIPLQQDNTKMGAFALASPTIADLDGDGNVEVIVGTSMGMIYVLDARNLYSREGWPVQFQRGIESRILVEDVLGDTNLELFVADVGGTVTCLNHKGEKLWHRNLVTSLKDSDQEAEILAASPMVLGDIDGDGILDLVQLLHVRFSNTAGALYLFAISADKGRDLKAFPRRIDKAEEQSRTDSEEFVIRKLPAPLLVDLHSDQSWLESYLHRGEAKFTKPIPSISRETPPNGGRDIGLHIVFPAENTIVIIEGGSGCAQTVSIGDNVLSMVQVDDVHGTGNLDLVITTASGNVVTLESPAPYHPLNVWNSGEMRGRTNAFAHGYSASQGIFVHDVSRQYRDIFGVYIPVTFEIFDNRPNIKNEPDRRKYNVEVRAGTSRPIFRKTYEQVGVVTERMYIPYGPGYYQLTATLKTTHGIIYEDTFHIGYNVNYMNGFGLMLWLPLLIASICIFLCGTRKTHWDDEDYDGDDRNGRQGILGGPLPE